MSGDKDMARPAEQALVSDQAPAGLAPTGFDPSRGQPVTCASCAGHGVVSSWSFGVEEPDECEDCHGSGTNWRYPRGAIAKYYSGPLIGREPMRTCSCTEGDPDPGCADHGDGSTWDLPPSDEIIPDGWLADGSWAP